MCAIFLSCPAHADGEVKNLKQYDYRASRRPWRCTVYDPMTEKLKGMVYYAPDGTINKVERFDGAGHKTDEAFYDSKGRLKPGPDSWAAMRWYYQDSVVRLRVSYDDQGKPIEKLFYSESGKMVGRLYRDDENVNPYVNAAMHKMLGGNNMAYYDQKVSHDQAVRLVDE